MSAEFTAAVVWKNYQLFVEPYLKRGAAGYDLFVSGGGAKNTAIMRYIQYSTVILNLCHAILSELWKDFLKGLK